MNKQIYNEQYFAWWTHWGPNKDTGPYLFKWKAESDEKIVTESVCPVLFG